MISTIKLVVRLRISLLIGIGLHNVGREFHVCLVLGVENVFGVDIKRNIDVQRRLIAISPLLIFFHFLYLFITTNSDSKNNN